MVKPRWGSVRTYSPGKDKDEFTQGLNSRAAAAEALADHRTQASLENSLPTCLLLMGKPETWKHTASLQPNTCFKVLSRSEDTTGSWKKNHTNEGHQISKVSTVKHLLWMRDSQPQPALGTAAVVQCDTGTSRWSREPLLCCAIPSAGQGSTEGQDTALSEQSSLAKSVLPNFATVSMDIEDFMGGSPLSLMGKRNTEGRQAPFLSSILWWRRQFFRASFNSSTFR